MRMLVGVIGHVDHGKTTLVRALTGIDTDRLPEEKQRQISIALGFAHLALDEAEIDFIDMPGHERFVRTMVSGATGIDAVLVVVAGNEGIKPQTVEHLDIAGLLGVARAIVVVTKADAASGPERTAALDAAVALTRRAGLQVTAALAVSARSGEGIDALRAALRVASQATPPRDDDGFPYLPIDRVFSVAGHGTVATGTLRRGRLAVLDEIEIAPTGRSTRLRGLQVHGERVTSAEPGQRVAANLRDVAPSEIARGAALTTRGVLAPSRWLSVSLIAVEHASLATGERLMLLFGTEEIEVRLRLLDRDVLAGGERVLAQLQASAPVAVPARERFILRRPSPPLTLGGGRVIDPAAVRLRRHVPAALARLAAIAEAEPGKIVPREVEQAGAAGIAVARLAQLAGVTPARVVALLAEHPVAVLRGRVAVLRAELERVAAALPGVLASDPAGLSREQLAALLPWAGPPVLDEAAELLAQAGGVQRLGGILRLRRAQQDRDHAEREAAMATAMLARLREGGLSPPDPAELAPDAAARRILERLLREGVAVRATDHVHKRAVVFHRDAVEAARRRLMPLLAGAGLLVGEAGAALGISRKYSVPLLEHFDAVRFTRRIADRRVLAAPEA